MNKDRLTAFTDGVVAIIITIMVLDLKVPHGAALSDLLPVLPTFYNYAVSYLYVAIYWNNHHHLMHTVHRVNGRILWANVNLLFWLSLIPFTTAWVRDNHFAPVPCAAYGVSLLLPAIAYYLLQKAIIHQQGRDGALAKALGRDVKGRVSLLLYIFGIAVSFFEPFVAKATYLGVALLWLVPDRRIEKALTVS